MSMATFPNICLLVLSIVIIQDIISTTTIASAFVVHNGHRINKHYVDKIALYAKLSPGERLMRGYEENNEDDIPQNEKKELDAGQDMPSIVNIDEPQNEKEQLVADELAVGKDVAPVMSSDESKDETKESDAKEEMLPPVKETNDDRAESDSSLSSSASISQPQPESNKESKPTQTSEISLDFLDDIDEDIATPSEIEELKKNLVSSNPIEQIPAKIKASQIQQLQTLRNTQRSIENGINTVKDIAEEVSKTPAKIQKTVEETQKTTKEVIETIQSTPAKIQNRVDQVKEEIESTKKAVDDTIHEIQAIPSNVQKSYQDTKEKVDNVVDTIQSIPTNVQKSIDETKKSVEDAQKKAEDTIENAVQFGKSVVDTTQTVVKVGSDVVQKISGAGALTGGDKIFDADALSNDKTKKEGSADSSVTETPFFFADSIVEEQEKNNAADLDSEVTAALELAMRAIEEADDVMANKKI